MLVDVRGLLVFISSIPWEPGGEAAASCAYHLEKGWAAELWVYPAVPYGELPMGCDILLFMVKKVVIKIFSSLGTCGDCQLDSMNTIRGRCQKQSNQGGFALQRKRYWVKSGFSIANSNFVKGQLG